MTKTGYYRSPIGIIKIVATTDHLVSLRFQQEEDQKNESSPLIVACKAELDAYFKGHLRDFSIPYQLSGTDFQNNVWTELAKIPYGKTLSYSALAIKVGDLKSIRAVGTANGKNKLPILIPCHRVIGKDGSLVGFSAGIDRKRWLLKHEGVIRGEQIEIFA